MFQFTGFAWLSPWHAFNMPGCPIRIPADHIVCADPRSFSQLIASFVASESLGIPHTPLSSLSPDLLIYCGALIPRQRPLGPLSYSCTLPYFRVSFSAYAKT